MGWSSSSCSMRARSTCSRDRGKSYSFSGMKQWGSQFSAMARESRRLSSGTSAASMVSPAACSWPPKRWNRSLHWVSIAWIFTPGMDRQEPTAVSPLRLSTTVGQWYLSQMRPAASPITPLFQPSPITTMALSLEKSTSRRIASSTCWVISCSRAWRVRLFSSRCAAMRSASWSSVAVSSRHPGPRPPACRRH